MGTSTSTSTITSTYQQLTTGTTRTLLVPVRNNNYVLMIYSLIEENETTTNFFPSSSLRVHFSELIAATRTMNSSLMRKMNKLSPFTSRLAFGRLKADTVKPPRRRLFSTTNEKINNPLYPRAAVAATIRWTCPGTNLSQYLLVQRKNPPDQNKWSFPGGKIELGEETWAAAKREISEETQLRECRWHSDPFLTTDAIIVNDDQRQNTEEKKDQESYAFHYVIAHCFAQIPACASETAPAVIASDDALDAKWWTVEELHDLDCSAHTIKIIKRAEELSRAGFLPTFSM